MDWAAQSTSDTETESTNSPSNESRTVSQRTSPELYCSMEETEAAISSIPNPAYLALGHDATNSLFQNFLHDDTYGVIVTDVFEVDNPIVFVNSAFECMSGYKAFEILGRNCRFLQCRGPFSQKRHPNVDLKTVSIIRSCLEKGQEFIGKILNFKKDGTPATNHLRITPILGKNNTVTHFLGIQWFTELVPQLQQPWISQQAEMSPISQSPASVPTQQPVPFATSARRQQSGDLPESHLLQLSDEVISQKVFSLLGPRDLARVATVCLRFSDIASSSPELWRAVCLREWGPETGSVLDGMMASQRLRWPEIAREISTLEAVNWQKMTVRGRVEPSRCNFGACAVGNRLVLFGGEGANMQAMNDTFVLDLAAESPEWRSLAAAGLPPPGRWGHTVSCLNDSWLVVFGGCGQHGLLNDVFVLDLDAHPPRWREVHAGDPAGDRPHPRSWHSSCTLQGTKLVVSGGCTESGRLLSDTHLLDLDRRVQQPAWREITTRCAPPSRLGHTMAPYDGSKVLMFGGLASKSGGSLRLRSNDAFAIDLAQKDPEWRRAAPAGDCPAPRLDHVSVGLPGGRVLVFGGSVSGRHSASQVYLLDPTTERPRWRKLSVTGQHPQFAWGHSTCVFGGTKVIILGGRTGEEWIINEVHQLSLLCRGNSRKLPG